MNGLFVIFSKKRLKCMGHVFFIWILLHLFNYLLINFLSFSINTLDTSIQQLLAQLGGLQNVTDPAIRRDLQSSAIRSGSLLHNLGSLLLELGRTTMLLRINPVSVGFLWQLCSTYFLLEIVYNFVLIYFTFVQSEAVVNSGPALYISPSGPNPLMVQVSY